MKSFWLGAAVRDRGRRRGGGELKRKCLSQRIQSALQEKQNQFSTSCEAATQRAVAVAATACGHFDIFFVGFLLYFIAFCCMLQLENSSCITLAVHEKSQWPTEIAVWGAVEGEGAWCGCVPRPAIAVVQCTSSSFCEPSKWNVKLNGNNFDWIFLCTIRLTKSRWKYRSKGCAQLAAYPVIS